MKYLLTLLLSAPACAHVELGLDSFFRAPYVSWGHREQLRSCEIESSVGMLLCRAGPVLQSRCSALFRADDFLVGPTACFHMAWLDHAPCSRCLCWQSYGVRGAYDLCSAVRLVTDLEVLPVEWGYWKPRLSAGLSYSW